MQGTQFRYVIKFVADIDKAVKFYHDALGLNVTFESPGWREFVTGDTTLALRPASDKNPAGKSNWASRSKMSRLSTGR
jgi:catechol 2,3-dioxygenase-like lactoylglutathione lyase family enzyme